MLVDSNAERSTLLLLPSVTACAIKLESLYIVRSTPWPLIPDPCFLR